MAPFLRARDVQLYRLCEYLSEALICFMVVFSPWAFGTTQPWAIWTMNAAGYVLGLLLAVKLVIRWLKGYRPARWDTTVQSLSSSVECTTEDRKSKVLSPQSTVHDLPGRSGMVPQGGTGPQSHGPAVRSSYSRVVLLNRSLAVLTFA